MIKQVTSFSLPSFCHSWAVGVGKWKDCLFHTQIELLEKAVHCPHLLLPSSPPPWLGNQTLNGKLAKIFSASVPFLESPKERWKKKKKKKGSRTKSSTRRRGCRGDREMGSLEGVGVEVGARGSWVRKGSAQVKFL